MWLANPHSILRGGFSLSRAKAVFIPPAKLVVVARSSYPKAIFLKSCKARKTERKSTNMSVKNRPEMIPKPYKRQGGMPYPIRNTPDLSNGAYRADFSRKWHREHTDFAPVPSYPTKPKKGAFFHAENEQEAAAGMGVLPE